MIFGMHYVVVTGFTKHWEQARADRWLYRISVTHYCTRYRHFACISHLDFGPGFVYLMSHLASLSASLRPHGRLKFWPLTNNCKTSCYKWDQRIAWRCVPTSPESVERRGVLRQWETLGVREERKHSSAQPTRECCKCSQMFPANVRVFST